MRTAIRLMLCILLAFLLLSLGLIVCVGQGERQRFDHELKGK